MSTVNSQTATTTTTTTASSSSGHRENRRDNGRRNKANTNVMSSTAKTVKQQDHAKNKDSNSKHGSDSNSNRPNTSRRNQRATGERQTSHKTSRKPKDLLDDTSSTSNSSQKATSSVADENDTDMNMDGHCFICTEPIKISAVGECEHRICHVCSLRLRALYKNKHCAYCKTELKWVVFTEDAIREYSSFEENEPACIDSVLGIRYQYQETFAESTALLKMNCPKEDCNATAGHWGKLKAHMRDEHRLSFCDLCIKYKKAFPHEHLLFTRNQLRDHYRGVSRDPSSGFRGHPECSFCNQNFYDDDQLYEHCRDRHEQCHLCVRSGVGRHQYYRNYKELEKHFNQDHFPCLYQDCLDSKFVVFATDIDLKAHEHEVHGVASTGQRSIQRNARRIDIDIVYTNGPSQRQRGQRDQSRTDRAPTGPSPSSSISAIRDHLRDDGQSFISTTSNSQSRIRISDESSSSSLGSNHHYNNSNNSNNNNNNNNNNNDDDDNDTRRIRVPVGFGQLSEEPRTIITSAEASSSNGTSSSTGDPQWPTLGNRPPTMQPPKMDPAVKKWVEPLLERFCPKLHNSQVKLTQLQILLTDYFKDKLSTPDFLSSIAKLTPDESKSLTGKIVTAVIDQLENEKKRLELLSTWKDQLAVDKQYPDLQPSDFYTSSTLGRSSTPTSTQPNSWNTNANTVKSTLHVDQDWDTPSWGKTAPVARYASASNASAGPSTRRPETNRTKASGSRTVSDVVRNGFTPVVDNRGSSSDFPALPTVPRTPRPVVGKPVASEWLGGRPNSNAANTAQGTSPNQAKAKKGKGKGKTLLFHCG